MRVPVGLRVSLFALAVMGAYAGYANYIPQVESKPPEELSLEGGNVTPALIATVLYVAVVVTAAYVTADAKHRR